VGRNDDLREPERLDAGLEDLAVDAITIADDMANRRCPWQRLDHLLSGPRGGRVSRYVDVEHPAPGEAQDDEQVLFNTA
jgi:hypothetical protein